MYRMIAFGFVSIIKEVVAKTAIKIENLLIFSFLTSIMYFQNVGMVTIATTELIPHKF